MAASEFVQLKRTSMRGLINYLQMMRDTLYRDNTMRGVLSIRERERDMPPEVYREIALLDSWIDELRAAQKRVTP